MIAREADADSATIGVYYLPTSNQGPGVCNCEAPINVPSEAGADESPS